MSRPFDEALERARIHLQRASIEGLETTRALLDAAILATGHSPGETGTTSGEIARALDAWIEHLRAGRAVSLPRTLAEPLAKALDREIERWQRRARSEPEARAVLRAFLGLREILWELGVRVEPASPNRRSEAKGRRTARDSSPRRSPRVQRFDVEG